MTRVLLQSKSIEELMAFVPSWHACILGPVPFGATERFRASINNILKATHEEANESCVVHARQLCAQFGVEYDEDEWEIIHLVQSVNAS